MSFTPNRVIEVVSGTVKIELGKQGRVSHRDTVSRTCTILKTGDFRKRVDMEDGFYE